MKITIKSTDVFVRIGPSTTQVWVGYTQGGTPVVATVGCIATHPDLPAPRGSNGIYVKQFPAETTDTVRIMMPPATKETRL